MAFLKRGNSSFASQLLSCCLLPRSVSRRLCSDWPFNASLELLLALPKIVISKTHNSPMIPQRNVDAHGSNLTAITTPRKRRCQAHHGMYRERIQKACGHMANRGFGPSPPRPHPAPHHPRIGAPRRQRRGNADRRGRPGRPITPEVTNTGPSFTGSPGVAPGGRRCDLKVWVGAYARTEGGPFALAAAVCVCVCVCACVRLQVKKVL